MADLKTSPKKLAKIVAPGLALTQLAAAAMLLAPGAASAHGTLEFPPSREYVCYGGSDSKGCEKFGTQKYEWRSNLQSSAGGDHTGVVPDGTLCAGGKGGAWAALNMTTEWKRTVITPDANGNVTFKYKQTAPHATAYFKSYITKDSYDFSRPLQWNDLQLIGEVGKQGAESSTNMPVKIPAGMTGKRIVYNVWQRSDSPEAFYACADVEVTGTSSPWKDIGDIRGGKKDVGTVLSLRVFDKTRGSDLEKHSITIDAGKTAASEWIYALAKDVNAKSQRVKIGKMGTDGQITPVKAADGNDIFGNGKEYNFAIDATDPGSDNGGGHLPGSNQPPVAKISGPAEVDSSAAVTLSASDSTDPDGDTLTFGWTVPAGITATKNGPTISFTAPKSNEAKSYTFTVTVDDGKASAKANHTVTVKGSQSGGANNAPKPVIDGPREAKAGEMFMLSAAMSSDADGDKLSYEWKFDAAEFTMNSGTNKAVTVMLTPKAVSQDSVFPITLSVSDGKTTKSLKYKFTVKKGAAGDL
ncbi:lytic polysaccharide monooxygenase [Trinickia mobilis]|uniref:lytic polysaccharide monooxygenase n=1 Tax=Trinickia mobilis TaxID=2816356 RepID=UPI001A8FA159|nr:lytic polysaccharide monooxygenase [Trinickia mobilis]